MFTFNKPSTCSLHLKCSNRIMHAFRVQYICLITSFYDFFTFLMLCLYTKHLRDAMDFDDRRRLVRIVTETCAAITTRLNVFLADRSEVGGRAANFILTPLCSVSRHFETSTNLERSKELWVRKAVVCG